MTKRPPVRYFKTSPEIIRLAVMLYVRFPLSLRDLEDLLHGRGIETSHETVRYRCNRFGPMFDAEIRGQRVEAKRAHRHWQWHLDEVYEKINGVGPRARGASTRAQTPALLKGLIFGPDGAAFSPTHTRKHGRLYRYYVSQSVLKFGKGACPIGRVQAGEIEAAVIGQLRAVFRQLEIIAGAWKAAQAHATGVNEADARKALQQLALCGKALSRGTGTHRGAAGRAGRHRPDGLNVRLRMDGLAGLAQELRAKMGEAA